jgi:hypothetical protein
LRKLCKLLISEPDRIMARDRNMDNSHSRWAG